MHFATSPIFFPNVLLPTSSPNALQPALSLRSRLLLLRTFTATMAVWMVARGRTSTLPIADFYGATERFLTAPAPTPNPSSAQGEQELFWETRTLWERAPGRVSGPTPSFTQTSTCTSSHNMRGEEPTPAHQDASLAVSEVTTGGCSREISPVSVSTCLRSV
ncbi:hypothetical protein OF83DRAFT_1177334 [Amylostereum chailletii]|nr:hypothetical protein OF83DRAFT_1177334 [Amylostereum chailletii]